ncbi:oligoendopeptidase F [Kosmotoga arenicorallina S304]|uniref:Oligoendopeptidase F n=1 Tax=Kosmotoga arenicorallina S304 TaxID=1453497 RepID=A0A182C8G9_9BACT|nr:M3 family oligoendopeptidase [Kosmotoga arenicorallina]OAA31809.1 oligoendopeptidase F [Kosmotoga arenicorallina S304]
MSAPVIKKQPRKFFPEELDLSEWSNVERELNSLLEFGISSEKDLETFLERFSELYMILQEQLAWRYIKMTCKADDEKLRQEYSNFYAKVFSKAEPYRIKLMKRFYDSPYKKRLDRSRYAHLDRLISNRIELFREENLPLEIKEKELSSKFGSIIGSLTIDYKGKEYTIMQLSKFQHEPDRKVREETWKLMMNKLSSVRDTLENLFDKLKEIRIPQAKNAGFDNYRDYMHARKQRFAYSVEDIFRFHNSVESVVVPFVKKLNKERREQLKLETLRPWDTVVEPSGRILKPFENIDEFVDKAIKILSKLDPEFGINLEKMKNSGLLDLENRKGKAPGGYNYPLDETGAPFIFMNATGVPENVRTLLHESGHAMHSFATVKERLLLYKHTPHEAAELASMSMELLTLDYLNEYYPDSEDLKLAKRKELVGTISFLPWCMIVDAFQQWIYTNPDHSPDERDDYFASLVDRFNTGINWTGLEKEKRIRWLLQPHIMTSPFYYIEYGIAQLGAIALYRNFKRNPEKALKQYKNFLSLGHSRPLDELYKAAGIDFDFSEGYIAELVEFVKGELEKL